MKPFRCEGAAFTLRTSVVLGAAIFLAACNGGPVQKSSSSADLSSVAAESSSVALSSSSVPSSSSVASSSSDISSEQSSSEASSSVQLIEKQVIVPRTECPPAPPEPDYGSWPANYAEAAYPSTHDTVRNFKELMAAQPAFNETGIDLPWNLHEPRQASEDPDARFPLVVYIHGGAERGSDPNAANVHLNNRHAKNFFASANSLLTPEHQEQFPAYIVAPLCNCQFYGNEWASNGGANFNMQDNPSRYGEAALALIEKLIKEKQIDPARIYVTGPSMGGGGSWEFAVRRPDLFAAAIPLAGHPPSTSDLAKLRETLVPVWSNHGEGDGNNPIGDAQNAVDYVSQGGGCAWISRYPKGTGADDPADSDPSDAPHNIWARAYTNPDFWPWIFSIAQPTETQLVYPDEEGGNVFEGETLDANNHYDAPKATAAPVVDGEIDDVWSGAPWMAMDVAWTGFENLTPPDDNQDFAGRYKAVWTEEHLYLLFEILDETIHLAGGGQTWTGDTVEIFLDEDQSGGQHAHDFNAFAYHVGYGKLVEDMGGNIDGHVTVEIKTEGNRHIWEMAIEIYAEHSGYNQTEQEEARVTLEAGKTMGFTPSYIDNDDNGGREHFMSSVDTEGHQNNQGYISADDFGSITLVQ